MSLFSELKRRNVVRVAIAYTVVSWVLLQVADLVLGNIGAPPWVIQALMLLVFLGFIAAIVISWAYELTPEGLRKASEVDPGSSATGQTGKKLDRVIIGFLAVAVILLLADRTFRDRPESETATPAAVTADEKVDPVAESESDRTSDYSIAVLPFANRSMKEEDLFFTDGIHDDLLTQLAKIHGLRVISRTSVIKYRDTQSSIPEIASELGVSTILEGGIQRAGNRIRINAQLIDVDGDEHIWAETYDREMTVENIFDIQSEITQKIVQAVRGELSDEEAASLARLPTDNLKAYEAFLQARVLINQGNYSGQKFIEAQPWAERAAELDPAFAEAWALLALIHAHVYWSGWDPSEKRLSDLKYALEQAKRYGPGLASTMVAEAEYEYRINIDYRKSLHILEKARRILPGNSEIYYRMSQSQRRLGNFEDSITNSLHALMIDPDYAEIASSTLITLLWQRDWPRLFSLLEAWDHRYDDVSDIRVHEARAQISMNGDIGAARAIYEKIHPNSTTFYLNLALNLPLLERDYAGVIATWDRPEFAEITKRGGWKGNRELSLGTMYRFLGDEQQGDRYLRQAVELTQKQAAGDPFSYADSLSTLASAQALLGDDESAIANIDKAVSMFPESADLILGRGLAGARAWVLAVTGKRAEALLEIERLIDQPAGLIRWRLWLDPRWDFFRDDPQFVELIRPKSVDSVER